MSKFAKLSGRWLSEYGMTMGISDVTPSATLFNQNEKKKDDAIMKCKIEARNFCTELE